MTFSFEIVSENDLAAWIDSKRACYKNYVDQYYGGWNDDVQTQLNTNSFVKAQEMAVFRRIVVADQTVGFCGYDIKPDRIDGITIHMYEHIRNHGIGSYFLRQVMEQSNACMIPAHLKVFKTNPARKLYERFGFCVYDESDSHYFMKYVP